MNEKELFVWLNFVKEGESLMQFLFEFISNIKLQFESIKNFVTLRQNLVLITIKDCVCQEKRNF